MKEQSPPFIAGYCFIAAVIDVLETPKRIVNDILRSNPRLTLTVPHHDLFDIGAQQEDGSSPHTFFSTSVYPSYPPRPCWLLDQTIYYHSMG